MQAQEVGQLITQYDTMKKLMESMSGKGFSSRMQAIREFQEAGGLDPGGRGVAIKKGTGKRLTNQEKARLREQRERDMRRRKREEKKKRFGNGDGLN